jgi:thiamine biosynthesis lipoprotein
MKYLQVLLCLLFISLATHSQEIFKRTLKLMGSRFEITVVAQNSKKADEYIDLAIAEVKRIEKLISSWDEQSQTNQINKQAGRSPVRVSPELFALIERSMAISKISDGAFDISYACMDTLWTFDGSMTDLPSAELINDRLKKIGYKNILLDANNSIVFLSKPGMKIGFGGIGKGYAADRAMSLLVEKGVSAGIINASGDMITWGRQPDGSEWKVAITNPLDKGHAYATLPASDRAVVTSGNYEKFIEINGKRYSHIIDPRTGYPAQGLLSATVFAQQAEKADALATAIFVLGFEAGINLVNQLPDVECILVDEQGNLHTSQNINIDTQ